MNIVISEWQKKTATIYGKNKCISKNEMYKKVCLLSNIKMCIGNLYKR